MKKKAHFLHIGKTGGTAIKGVLKNNLHTLRYEIELHNHNKRLSDIPRGEKVFFFLRDPISRYVSGFCSRQRKGRPRYYSEWGVVEKEIFEVFETPNQLANALADCSSKHHELSKKAMRGIGHLNRYKFWYRDFDYFESRKNDILYIGFQESLDQNFDQLKKILGITISKNLPKDDVGAHRAPVGLDWNLDEVATDALIDWYNEDLKFVEICRNLVPCVKSDFP